MLDKIIGELVVKQKKKVLIFSGFTRMLDCCEDFLHLRGGNGEHFQYMRLDGGTGRARRNLGIRMFNQEGSDYRVMLISTRAGGLGINLATASDVVMLDQDWNPQIMLQAEARAHRIGQKHPVTVYKLCTQGTVEEQMMGRIQKKLYLSAKVTESMRDIHSQSAAKKKSPGRSNVEAAEDDMPQLDTTQLMSLVRRGAQALTRPEIDINDMLSWDFPTMLEKCKNQPADIHVSEQTRADVSVKEEDEKEWLAQIEQVEARVFDGRKHAKAKESSGYDGIAQEWSREQRRIGKNTTVIIDGHVVSKESANCAQWEAVPTLAGKDPRLAEAKREKKPQVVNQEVREDTVWLSCWFQLMKYCSNVRSAGTAEISYFVQDAPEPTIMRALTETPNQSPKAKCSFTVRSTSVLIVNKILLMLEACSTDGTYILRLLPPPWNRMGTLHHIQEGRAFQRP